MAAATTAKDIPAVGTTEDERRRALSRAREEVQRLLGFGNTDPLDMAVTWRQLKDQGFVDMSRFAKRASGAMPPGSLAIPPGIVVAAAVTPDLTPPPSVVGFTAVAALTHVLPSWTAPSYTQGHGHYATRIYGAKRVPGSANAVFADATLQYEAIGGLTLAAIPSEPNVRWHLWAKNITNDGVESTSPVGGTNGVIVTTGQDVSHLLDVLTAAAYDPASTYTKVSFRADQFFIAPVVTFDQESTPTGTLAGQLWFKPSTGVTKTWDGAAWQAFTVPLPFIVQTTPQTINGVLIPAGVYMDAAYIKNLTAMVARLGAAWIDDAMIASLSAAHLTVGDGTVGGNLKSTTFTAGSAGWILRPDGTAEFDAGVVRGQLVASQIDTRNLTIKDGSGTVLFGSGTNLGSAYINPASGWLNANVSIGSNGALAGAGGGTVTLGGLGAGAFATLSQITNANITTYVASAAIDLAQIRVASIGTLAALSALMGTVTIDSSGYLKGGQTAYNTGTGFFLGYSGAAYKFSIGDGTKGLTWDGSALVINGSLSASAIDAVATANITDLAVSTIKIANQAVTIPSSAYTAGSATGTIQTVTFTSTGAPVNISASMQVSGPTAQSALVTVALKRGSTTIYSTDALFPSHNNDYGDGTITVAGQGILSFSVGDTPSAGSVTYTLELLSDSAGGTVSKRSLVCLETKK